MGLKLSQAKTGSGGVCAPDGSHAARCYSVVDLGTHTEVGKYGRKTNRKIRISWEIPDETYTFKPEEGPQPFNVNKQYNFVLGEKAHLQVDLQAWFNKKLTPEVAENLEISALLGKVCLIAVQHEEAKNGNVYAKVASLAPLPKGMTCKAAVNAPVYYDVTMGKNEVFEALPKFIKEEIEKCEEWNGGDNDEGFLVGSESELDGNFLGGIDKESIKDSESDDNILF